MKKLFFATLATLVLCANVAFASVGLLRFGATFTPSCSQSTAFLARTSGFSYQQRASYDAVICPLVTAGTWAKLDALYILAAPNQTASLLNLVSTNYSLTVTATMTFGPNAGYTGDANTGYLNTNFTPSTAGGHYAVGSGSVGVFITNNRQQTESWAALGVLDSTFTYTALVAPFISGQAANNVCSIGTGAYSTDNTITGTQGLWACNQTGGSSGTQSFYHNTTDLNDQTADSPTLPNGPIVIGGWNLEGLPGVVDNSGDTFAFAFIGSGLTSADITALYNAFSNFNIAAYPPVAANWGFTNSEFSYNFAVQGLSGIDTNNTLAAGYSWYGSFWFGLNEATPAANYSATSGQYVSITNGRIGTAGDLTAAYQGAIASNVLTVSSMLYGQMRIGQTIAGNSCISGSPTISSFGSGTGGVGTYNLSSSASSCSSSTKLLANAYVGTLLQPGGYFEIQAYLVPSCGSSGSFSSFWMQSIQGLYSANFNSGYGEAAVWQENDVGEFAAQNDANIIQTTNTNGSGTIGTSNEVHQGYTWPTDGHLHKIGLLWVPTTKNNGTGLYQFYLDGVHLGAISGGPSDVTYSSGGGSSPAATPSNPNGIFYGAESQTRVLLIDAWVTNSSGSCTFKIQQVNVWH